MVLVITNWTIYHKDGQTNFLKQSVYSINFFFLIFGRTFHNINLLTVSFKMLYQYTGWYSRIRV